MHCQNKEVLLSVLHPSYAHLRVRMSLWSCISTAAFRMCLNWHTEDPDIEKHHRMCYISSQKLLAGCILMRPLCVQSTRSYLFVEDVAEAFEVVLRKGVVGETYNIGTQKERTVMDVASCIAKRFNLPMDNIVHVRDRAFNDQR